jgi:hypothetical protein
MVAPFYGEAADAIAQAAGIEIRDLGTVDGHPGFLLITGQTVPGWDAESLPQAAAETRVRQERNAWRLVWATLGLLFLVRFVVALAQ